MGKRSVFTSSGPAARSALDRATVRSRSFDLHQWEVSVFRQHAV